ncbi:MAG: hypothetical protein AAF530_19995 [Pseudomonadota bacterium]
MKKLKSSEYECPANFDGRERYLIAVTLIEWIENEKQRGKFERTSDIHDLEQLLEREFPDENKMVKAGREGWKELSKEIEQEP